MFPGPPETRSHPLFSRRIAAHPHMIPPIPAGIPPTQDPEEPRSVGARPVDDLFMRSRLPLSCLLGGSGLRTRNRSSPRARILVSSDLEGPMYPRGCPMKAPNRALFHSPRHDPPSTRPGPPPTIVLDPFAPTSAGTPVPPDRRRGLPRGLSEKSGDRRTGDNQTRNEAHSSDPWRGLKGRVGRFPLRNSEAGAAAGRAARAAPRSHRTPPLRG